MGNSGRVDPDTATAIQGCPRRTTNCGQECEFRAAPQETKSAESHLGWVALACSLTSFLQILIHHRLMCCWIRCERDGTGARSRSFARGITKRELGNEKIAERELGYEANLEAARLPRTIDLYGASR